MDLIYEKLLQLLIFTVRIWSKRTSPLEVVLFRMPNGGRLTFSGAKKNVSDESRLWQMVGQAGNNHKAADAAMSKVVKDFVDSLSEEQRMLVILKSQLYGGTWEPMLDDLRNRLAGKPYIFKLANRIQDDIERIEQMSQFEQEHNIDLADYVEMP